MISDRCGLSERTVATIRHVFEQHPELERAVLFGSRAKGNFKAGSDIDLALFGPKLSQQVVNHLYEEIDDLPIPYGLSLVVFSTISDSEVKAHIERVGIVFYEREPASIHAMKSP